MMRALPWRFRTRLWLLASACFFVFNLRESIRCGQTTGCVDKYWADFWLISYSDGYLRRALLGEVVSLLFDTTVDYRVINLLALLIAAAVLIPVYAIYLRRWKISAALPFALVVCGPTTMLFSTRPPAASPTPSMLHPARMKFPLTMREAPA